jgi:NADPH:quinone reductase-like Zn-dependent oxidoreductase
MKAYHLNGHAGAGGVVTVGSVEHFAAMNRFLTENAIHPIIDRVYGFDQAPEAFAHLRSGSHFGKIAVKL